MIERHIASVQRITSVIPVENADTLVKLQILGWQVVGYSADDIAKLHTAKAV